MINHVSILIALAFIQPMAGSNRYAGITTHHFPLVSLTVSPFLKNTYQLMLFILSIACSTIKSKDIAG